MRSMATTGNAATTSKPASTMSFTGTPELVGAWPGPWLSPPRLSVPLAPRRIVATDQTAAQPANRNGLQIVFALKLGAYPLSALQSHKIARSREPHQMIGRAHRSLSAWARMVLHAPRLSRFVVQTFVCYVGSGGKLTACRVVIGRCAQVLCRIVESTPLPAETHDARCSQAGPGAGVVSPSSKCTMTVTPGLEPGDVLVTGTARAAAKFTVSSAVTGDGIVEHASGIVANLMQGYAACYTVSTPAACPECRMAGPRLQSQLFRRCDGRTVMCA